MRMINFTAIKATYKTSCTAGTAGFSSPAEVNPHNFQPFGGLADGSVIENGLARPPDVPGIGFETRSPLIRLFRGLLQG